MGVKFEEGKKIGPDTPVYVLIDHILKLRAIQKGKGDSSFDEAYRAFIRIVDGKGIIERYQAMVNPPKLKTMQKRQSRAAARIQMLIAREKARGLERGGFTMKHSDS